ncbi:MAG: tetratricopeptide repeat protein [Gemmatimonadetes bacterium]|nr:tetratricopeptide repeat protein [Gemmatimonadota bacterium]
MTDLTSLIEDAKAAERAGAWDGALAAYFAALERARESGARATVTDLLRWIGTVHRERGELDRADAFYRESLEQAEADGAAGQVAAALNCLALVAQIRGEVDRAEELFARASASAREAGDDRLGAMVDQNLGTLANIRGDVPQALSRYRSALERLRRLGDERAVGWVLHNIGMAHVDLGELDAAARVYAEALDAARRADDQLHVGNVELGFAELHLARGDLAAARGAARRAFELFTRLDSRPGIGEAHRLLATIHREEGRARDAEAHYAEAVRLARECGDALVEAEAENGRALLWLAQGTNERALEALNRSHALFARLQARRELADVDRRLDRLEQTYLEVVRRWGESIDAKDAYTAGHCNRVADYACALAAAVGFAGRDLTWLRMGAFLHDVGKTAVPLDILNKPGKLTDEEWEQMRAHTTAGDEIVRGLSFPWDIRPVVRSHHERWDGRGYPDGLAGEEIPLTARILCVADVFDALTTARSYRRAFSRAEALAVMRREAGAVCQPELFELFQRLLETGVIGPPSEDHWSTAFAVTRTASR